MVSVLAFVAGYWAHSSRFGALAGVLVALGGGMLRDLWLGLPLWALEHPQYILLAALVGFWASRVEVPLSSRATGALGIMGGQRAYSLTEDPATVSVASVLTATEGGFIAALIGKHLLGEGVGKGGKTPQDTR